jgi:hypothetical protein
VARAAEHETLSCISRYLVRPTVSDLIGSDWLCGIPSQGIKRTAGSHPSEGMPQTRPKAWQRISVGGHRLFRICSRSRGRPPETLSLGWLPAVRFIPQERVSGGLPLTVDLRRIMNNGDISHYFARHVKYRLTTLIMRNIPIIRTLSVGSDLTFLN